MKTNWTNGEITKHANETIRHTTGSSPGRRHLKCNGLTDCTAAMLSTSHYSVTVRAETYRWTPEEHAARISLPQTEGPLSGTADTFSSDTDSILAGCALNTTCSLPYCCFGKPSFRMETGRSSPRECHPVVDLQVREREGTQPDWLYRQRDFSCTGQSVCSGKSP